VDNDYVPFPRQTMKKAKKCRICKESLLTPIEEVTVHLSCKAIEVGERLHKMDTKDIVLKGTEEDGKRAEIMAKLLP